MKKEFTKSERERYSRHFMLKNFGMAAQQRLSASAILVIGAGGLGNAALPYLAAAGIGSITIVDFDVVSLSNLQRQILFETEDVGQSKVFTIAERLRRINPTIDIFAIEEKVNEKNILDLVNAKNYNLILDCTDNFSARYLINDACVLAQKTLVFAAIHQFEGQIAVFNYPLGEGKFSPNYRAIYAEKPSEKVKNCAEEGVLGVVAGIVGSMQAAEAIKILSGVGETLVGKMLFYDALDHSVYFVQIPGTEVNIVGLQAFEEVSNCNKE